MTICNPETSWAEVKTFNGNLADFDIFDSLITENRAMTIFNLETSWAEVKTFNGTLADFDMFDNLIKQCLVMQNLPQTKVVMC